MTTATTETPTRLPDAAQPLSQIDVNDVGDIPDDALSCGLTLGVAVVRLFALVVVVFASSCAGTFHARAVQQTAGGAVLLASGVGGAVGSLGGAVVVGSLPEPPQSSIVGLVAGGVVAVGFIAIGSALLAAGSNGLDTYGPQDTRAITEAVERGVKASPQGPTSSRAFAEILGTCLTNRLCPDDGAQCVDEYQREFAEAEDQPKWLMSKGCL